jgi:hypothetical protein
MIIMLLTVKKSTQIDEDDAVLRNKRAINSLEKLSVKCHTQTLLQQFRHDTFNSYSV